MSLYCKGVSTRHIGNYAVASLPTAATFSTLIRGDIAYATNGRKNGEGAAAGTGVLCYWDTVAWRRVSDDTTVAA